MNTDIAWAAGILEGEGSFSFSTKAGTKETPIYRSPKITVHSIDRDMVEGLRVIFGGAVYGPKSAEGRRDIWTWSISSKAKVVEVIDAVRPYMRVARKIEQMDRLYTGATSPDGRTTRHKREE